VTRKGSIKKKGRNILGERKKVLRRRMIKEEPPKKKEGR